MKAIQPAIATLVLGLCVAAFGAQAQTSVNPAAATTPGAATSSNRSNIDMTYKQDKKKCDGMPGDAKDQCIVEAKTRYMK